MMSASLLACGDDGHSPAPVMLDEPRPQPEPEPIPNEPQEYRYQIEAVDELPLRTHVGETIGIAVRLTEVDGGDVVSGESIAFEVVQTLDTETAILQTPMVSDAEGHATAQLHLGSETTGSAVVRVSHPAAQAVDIEVVVAGPQVGTIRVDIIEPSTPPNLDPFRIQVFPANAFACSDYRPRHHIGVNATRAVEVPTADPVDLENFTPASYTVLGEALGAGGLVLAGGCVDAVNVVAGQTVAIAIPLTLYPISPTGVYEVNGNWDISQVVSSSNQTAGTLVGVIEFMANPGQSIFDLVMTEIEEAVDLPLIDFFNYSGFTARITQTINNWLFRWAPIAAFSAVASDLNDMLHNLQVTSILEITKTNVDAEFLGREYWSELTIDWTWRCQLDPTIPNCDQYTVDLQDTGAQAAAVQFEWTGYVDGYDRLSINSHQVSFDIGRLQMYLLNEVILPDLTGGAANSLAGALQYWVDCPGLAANAVGNNDVCLGPFCLGETLIEGACNAAMAAVADFVIGPIEGQDVIADLELSASALLVDLQPDGLADELRQGQTDGVRASSTEEVHATWSAVRIGD